MVKVLVYVQHELSARVNVIDKVCRREASRLFGSSSTSNSLLLFDLFLALQDSLFTVFACA